LKDNTDEKSSELPQIEILREVAFYSLMTNTKSKEKEVIGYFENLSLHLTKESLPICLEKYLKDQTTLNYFSAPVPALEIFSLLKQGTAKPMMDYLKNLRKKADPNFKSICANIPEAGILSVFKLAKADSEKFFILITDN
jgi:hypothetical protein